MARSHIVSYAEDGALLTELFTRDGGGTLVAQEQFEVVREVGLKSNGKPKAKRQRASKLGKKPSPVHATA